MVQDRDAGRMGLKHLLKVHGIQDRLSAFTLIIISSISSFRSGKRYKMARLAYVRFSPAMLGSVNQGRRCSEDLWENEVRRKKARIWESSACSCSDTSASGSAVTGTPASSQKTCMPTPLMSTPEHLQVSFDCPQAMAAACLRHPSPWKSKASHSDQLSNPNKVGTHARRCRA